MTRRARLTAALASSLLLVAACASDDSSSDAGGWLGGEPSWRAASGDGAADTRLETAGAAATVAGEAEAAVPGDVRPLPEPSPVATGPLRAGSVDDNARFDEFLAYLERAASNGVASRPFDPTGRILVHVVGSDGRPVHGVEVAFAPIEGAGSTVTLRTDASGSARFLPATVGGVAAASGQVAASYRVTSGEGSTDVAPGEELTLTLGEPGGAEAGVPVDVMFVLDATGSMGDEIEQLRSTMADVARRLDALSVQPDIRFAMTVYRDEGDAFVTSVYDFTDDVQAFTEALDAVVADGGGDNPEALDEALAASLGEPSWRDPAITVQLSFLVADAPPHVDRQVPTPYTQSIADAAGRGITIHAIAASSTDDQAELVFRQIAQATGGRFVFLAYGGGATATGPNTDIDALDYEELPLGDLVVRLVSDALTTLTGTTVDAPPESTTTVPATNPPGQD